MIFMEIGRIWANLRVEILTFYLCNATDYHAEVAPVYLSLLTWQCFIWFVFPNMLRAYF